MMFFERLLGVALAAATMAGVVIASHAPLTSHASADAMLRLAWSARPERIETCHRQSDEELERLPQHMRQPIECEGAAAHYRLTVRAGGRVIADHLVRAGGLRQDRRLFVFQEIALPAGEAVVDIRFDRIESSTPPIVMPADKHHEPSEDHESSEDGRGNGTTIPP